MTDKANFEIEIGARQVTGSAAARRTRQAGFVPAIVYSEGQPGTQIQVPMREFTLLASRATFAQPFTFRAPDKQDGLSQLDGQSALVKSVQKHSVTGSLEHIDFLLLRAGHRVTVTVPVHLNGEPTGVKNSGGVLAVACREVALNCLPSAIPESLEHDISGLEIGENVHASDLALPEGVELDSNPDEVVASVLSSRKAVESEQEGAAAEGGEEAAATEGAESTESSS